MKEVQKILFPTDFSYTAKNAFRYCLVLASKIQAPIEVVHVIYPEYEPFDLPILTTQLLDKELKVANNKLKDFVDQGLLQVQMGYNLEALPDVTVKVEVGSPIGVIKQLVLRGDIDLVVMGTNSDHNKLEKWIGSTTSTVMKQVDCPVLAVPPNASFTNIKKVAYASDLKETDPYHIWYLGKWLATFHPSLHCVHVETEINEEEIFDLMALENFFRFHAKGQEIFFERIIHPSIEEGLEEFIQKEEIDLLVMYAPEYSFLERLFHKSHTKRMVYRTNIPLLIWRS